MSKYDIYQLILYYILNIEGARLPLALQDFVSQLFAPPRNYEQFAPLVINKSNRNDIDMIIEQEEKQATIIYIAVPNDNQPQR